MKAGPVTESPWTRTATGPLPASAGTVTTSWVLVDILILAIMPLMYTVSLAVVSLNPVPVMVTVVAAGPCSGDTWLMTGGAIGVPVGGGTGGFEPGLEFGVVGLLVLPQALSMTVMSRMAAAFIKSVFQVGRVKGVIVSDLMTQN